MTATRTAALAVLLALGGAPAFADSSFTLPRLDFGQTAPEATRGNAVETVIVVSDRR